MILYIRTYVVQYDTKIGNIGMELRLSYEGDVSANSAPPKNVENIEIVKTASRPVWHPGGCIGASNGASTALKLPGKPEIHVFFVRLYTYAGP